jgi:hypothetical protein
MPWAIVKIVIAGADRTLGTAGYPHHIVSGSIGIVQTVNSQQSTVNSQHHSGVTGIDISPCSKLSLPKPFPFPPTSCKVNNCKEI